jgi:hypothetical protein
MKEMKENNYNDVIIKLQDYMLNDKLINNDTHVIINKKNNIRNYKNTNKNKDNNFFLPKEKDTLFWCFYIIKHGLSMYEYPGNTSFINEKNEKFKLIENLRNKKNELKNHKIKNIKEDIEDELANKETIGIKTFISLCICENINIIFIDKKKYFDLLVNDDNPYYVIHLINNKYYYETDTDNNKISHYKNNLFKIENFNKPLNSITYYKIDELTEIYNKLNNNDATENNNSKKMTKKELYQTIINIIQ